MKTHAGHPKRLTIGSSMLQTVYSTINKFPVFPSRSSYNLTISNKESHRFVWFRVAKVGTRTILAYFNEAGITLDVEQASKLYYQPDSYKDHFKFAFVRNPWDRLASCWQNKVVQNNHFGFEESLRTEMLDFRNFIAFVEKLDVQTCDRHLASQASLIDLNNIDFLGRMESFERDFHTVVSKLRLPKISVPKNNVSNVGAENKLYDDELKERVGEIYSRDIQLFGYDTK